MLNIICWSLMVSLIINGGMFLIAFKRRSDKLTDISYAVSFIVLALLAFRYARVTPYSVIGTGLVCVWALRIGGFLLYRVLRTGSDKRFDGIRDHFWQFGKFWLGQAITVWVLMIPLLLSNSENTSSWYPIALTGATVWLIGFVLEAVADLQKYRFTHNPANADRWIDEGVWRYSRHPNYFGEMMVWIGIYLYAAPSLSVLGKVIGVISPLFITLLLLFVSGVPILEKGADKRWGSLPSYVSYKRHTSLLVPLPKKKT